MMENITCCTQGIYFHHYPWENNIINRNKPRLDAALDVEIAHHVTLKMHTETEYGWWL